MSSKIKRLQELDDELKKIQQELSDKMIDQETAASRIAKVRSEIRSITSDLKSESKKGKDQ